MTTNEEQILHVVCEVLRNELQVQARLGPQTDLARDLQLDSLKQLALVVALENRFRICFDPQDEQGLQTIQDVVRLIAARLAGAQRVPGEARVPDAERVQGAGGADDGL